MNIAGNETTGLGPGGVPREKWMQIVTNLFQLYPPTLDLETFLSDLRVAMNDPVDLGAPVVRIPRSDFSTFSERLTRANKFRAANGLMPPEERAKYPSEYEHLHQQHFRIQDEYKNARRIYWGVELDRRGRDHN